MTAPQSIRLKYLYSPSGDANHPNEQVLSVYRDHGVIPKSSRSDNFNKTPENVERYLLVHPGDLVVNRMKAWQGSLGVSDHRGIVSGDYEVLRPTTDSVSGKYMHYALRSRHMIGEYRVRSTGIRPSQWRLYWDQMGDIRISLPSLAEQERIADYLDHETAQIDTLVTEQQRLVEMLQDRRSALVERTVTKGIDKSVEVKESTLSWTDTVPSHWRVANIRRFAKMKTGHTPSRSNPDYWEKCTIPWITLADVWQLRSSKQMYVEDTEGLISELGLANSAAELLPAGTVVLSRTASVGFAGIMPQPMATSQDYWNWICGPELMPEYLVWVFRAMRQEFNALMIGSTHKTIYQPVAAAMRIPVPPLEEQKEIVTHIEEHIARIDTLIAESERLIDLSQERRFALITAAVTGQIGTGEDSGI
ncbi:restriction endonuclease subunit S [Streptomyces sp. NPDC085466]|uniref:restriction endonuclease subunit S n=1 Tax=Streptomyces sp. NPDC085466 TaxID=3365725 RepID=UPI0037D25563